MKSSVKLQDIVDAFDMQNDQIFHYLDTKTNELIMLSQEELWAAERDTDLDRYPDWQREMIQTAQAILEDETNQYLELPTQFDIHEYHIMEKFCLSITDPAISDEMYYAIKGSGAFRRFKDGLYRYDLTEDWYEYRNERFRKIAIAWCEENSVEYV